MGEFRTLMCIIVVAIGTKYRVHGDASTILSVGNYTNYVHISMIMFLPSETALEKLRELDSEFMDKAWKNHIYPAGPIGLVNILSHAKFQIVENKQVENYKVIIEEINAILSTFSEP